MHLAALVVTHNRLDHLKRTVAQLLDEKVDTVLVVDNASADGTRDWLTAHSDPKVSRLHLAENLGGAGGFAAGLAQLREQAHADWVVLMDDDARPETGAIARFRALDLAGVDAIAAAVRYPDGRICEMNRPSNNPFASVRRFFSSFSPSAQQAQRVPDEAFSQLADERPVDMATFVGLFLSRAVIAAQPDPDPRLFLYGDDMIYTLMMTQAGWRMMLCPSIRFTHDCATLNPAGIYRPVWKIYYHHRNGVLLYKQAAGWLFWLPLALRLPRWARAAHRYGTDAPEFKRLLRAALWDGVTGRLDAPPKGIPAPPSARR